MEHHAKDADFPGELRVIVYNEDADKLSESLGITDERLHALQEASRNIWNKERNISTAMAAVSRVVNNANELAYIFFAIGSMRSESKKDH